MRSPLIATLCLAALAAQPALAAPKKHVAPAAPQSIGTFGDWQAATHPEGGQTVCYAFVRASASAPAVPGRGDVVLTVAQRPSGRDAVAISAGFTYPANASVSVEVGDIRLAFYTAGRSAFARDGHAAVAAFNKGAKAVAVSPGPRNTEVRDTFSLRGFGAAYAAATKACPAK